MTKLSIIPGNCSGCRICELVCSFQHKGEFKPSAARIRIETDRMITLETAPDQIDVPHVCRQCVPAACADSCPQDAIYPDGQQGYWRVDSENCIGCELCIQACPHAMITMDPDEEVAQKCDLCAGRPQCIIFCPQNAIVLAE